MIGAILGDIVGSVYEFNNIKTKEFEFFGAKCDFTDDTVMTIAVADALLQHKEMKSTEAFKQTLVECMHKYGKMYPGAGYGGRFAIWLNLGFREPYQSYGNGSAMRVSPVAWFAKSLKEAEAIAIASAAVTHDHIEGIKGAVATAGAQYLAKTGASKAEIKAYISKHYAMDFTLDEIRPTYAFNETCQRSVPEALQAFLEAEDYEDAIRNAVSLGGDSDTQAAIAGAVAEAFFGVPDEYKAKALAYLDAPLRDIAEAFTTQYVK